MELKLGGIYSQKIYSQKRENQIYHYFIILGKNNHSYFGFDIEDISENKTNQDIETYVYNYLLRDYNDSDFFQWEKETCESHVDGYLGVLKDNYLTALQSIYTLEYKKKEKKYGKQRQNYN